VSQVTEISFYSEAPETTGEALVIGSLHALDDPAILDVRIDGLNAAKLSFEPEFEYRDERFETVECIDGEFVETVEPGVWSSIKRPTVEQLVELVGCSKGLSSACLIDRDRLNSLNEVMQSRVPEDLRGEFAPSDLYLVFGYEEVIHEDYVTAEIEIIARPRFQLKVFGYGLPYVGPEAPPSERSEQFLDHFAALPPIEEVLRRLETFVGPLERLLALDY
jgi:hypothetical protein